MLLQAGNIQVQYENGFLRYFRCGEQEVLRMVYFAVRDQDWNTIPGELINETITTYQDGFQIHYQYRVDQEPVRMLWEVTMQGFPEGKVVFAIDGLVQQSFLRNRLGLCVLHPIEGVAGIQCRLTHADGSESMGIFPQTISPEQPFRNVRAMDWPISGGGRASLWLEGEVFETEDQRNWTDASYKTYCTPLSLLFPVRVEPGTRVMQQMTFRVDNVPARAVAPMDTAIRITTQEHAIAFPELGLGLPIEAASLSDSEIYFLQNLHMAHLQADVFTAEENASAQLEAALEQSRLLDKKLALHLFFGKEPEREAAQVAEWLRQAGAWTQSITVFDAQTRTTTVELWTRTAPLLRSTGAGVLLGGGTDANYAEFARNSFRYAPCDFLSYSINPQVHAFDDLSLVENMTAQGDTVRSARQVYGDKPVHVSPVTLRPRFNAVATSGSRRAQPPADPRQSMAFAAGWTLGSLKYLAEAGVGSVTWYETTGPRGICAGDVIFPVGRLLAFLSRFRPQSLSPSRSTQPLKVSPLLLHNAEAACLVIANHTPEPQVVRPPEPAASGHWVSILQPAPFPDFELTEGKLRLAPYALVAGFFGLSPRGYGS